MKKIRMAARVELIKRKQEDFQKNTFDKLDAILSVL